MRKYLILITFPLLFASCMRRGTGIDMARLELIDSVVYAHIAAEDIPGAVVGVVKDGRLIYEKAFGHKSLVPEKDTMTVETMFDLASLSKCVGTTLSFMQLVETGKVRLVDPVQYYLPDFLPWEDPETHEKDVITVQDLLTHSSGLDAYLKDVPGFVEKYGTNCPDSLKKYICTEVGRNFKPGTRQLYSCLNFITLQFILEQVTGERLCDYAQKNVFDALGLKHTCYLPIDRPELKGLCAPTEMQADSTVLKAQVHDPIARLVMGGNSGNAGVFSNVEDLAVIASALLNGGEYKGRRILSPLAVKKMFTVPEDNAYEVARSLGWDTYYTGPYTSGDIFCLKYMRGHTGYTGTSMILDPDTNMAVIVLTHRVHPHDDGSASRLRSVIASIVAGAVVL